MTVADLKELCKDRDITGYSALKKAELVELLLK
ncbi:MAG: Rho termination factor N-terminal domain-containing protein [Candidatus Izemoplasmataceae bacterium]